MTQAVRILILIVGVFSSKTLFADPEATRWVQKMGEALKQQNYDGIFTYMRGTTYETVRIVHRYENGKETESLFNLNGDVREMRRTEDGIICYHPGEEHDTADFQHSPVHIGPFSPVFAERVTAASHLYHTSLHGEDRIAGRAAVKIGVSPPNNDRYGYRLWLDKETGLLLQSHLVDRGRVKEIFQFTSINIGDDADLTLAAIPDGTVSHPMTMVEPQETQGKPVWRVAWLPDGFRPVRQQGNRLHFSDGIATVSVFVEKEGPGDLPEMTTTVGGTVVITRRLQQSGPQITVVGEIPVQTARRVAESVEPVLY